MGGLARDPALGRLVDASPGRRVPGAVDGFELAVRAVIGQQVSVMGARTVAGRLVLPRRAREPLADPEGRSRSHPPLPDPGCAGGAGRGNPAAFAMPAGRRRALGAGSPVRWKAMRSLDAGADPNELRRSLVALPGIGPWTAEYVAMRALRDPDAFMPTDLGIRRGAAACGLPEDPAGLIAHAETWRPWRSYAMAHLWASRPPRPPDSAPDA